MTKVDLDTNLAVLRASAQRLRDLVTPLDDSQLDAPAYPTAWSIADVLSHIGSAAVIGQRRLDDAVTGQATPDGFAPSVWGTWNAKSSRAKAGDGLAADGEFITQLAALDNDQRSALRFSMGPLTFDATEFVALRLNEHVLHTWDIDVALHPEATVPADAATLLVDNLELIARFTAKPTGGDRTITVATSEPTRSFTITVTPDSASFAPGNGGRDADVALPAEAFIRLVYGRLDAAHTPAVDGDGDALDELRRVFPGP